MKKFKHNINVNAPGLALASSSSSSSSFQQKKNDKNMYGSLDDLQAYALQSRNHSLTVKLVEAKKAWEALQASFRANAHARFLYQTALARIVNHVQDFSDLDDPTQLQLVSDLLKWTEECEHIVLQNRDIHISSTTSEDSTNSQDIILKGTETNRGFLGSNRIPIIDYNDVQVYVDTSLEAHVTNIPSAWTMNHESLRDQNDNLEKEVMKWNASMTRIRVCNKREASELLTHQKTLRKVVERVQESDFSRKDEVLEWYEACQREAEQCGSFSEQDAAKCCNRCNSRLSISDPDDSGIYIEEEARTPYPPSSTTPQKAKLDAFQPIERLDTPTTIASHHDEAASSLANGLGTEEERLVQNANQLAHDDEHQHKNAAGIATEHELVQVVSHPSAKDIAAANVDDPPDRIAPTATNLQVSSIVQDKHRNKGCGAAICRIM
jgi:hypothetical protein